LSISAAAGPQPATELTSQHAVDDEVDRRIGRHDEVADVVVVVVGLQHDKRDVDHTCNMTPPPHTAAWDTVNGGVEYAEGDYGDCPMESMSDDFVIIFIY